MTIAEHFGITLFLAEEQRLPEPHSDNWPLFPEGSSREEFMQWIRHCRKRQSREVLLKPQLWDCPEHRLTRNITAEMERCCRWLHYGER